MSETTRVEFIKTGDTAIATLQDAAMLQVVLQRLSQGRINGNPTTIPDESGKLTVSVRGEDSFRALTALGFIVTEGVAKASNIPSPVSSYGAALAADGREGTPESHSGRRTAAGALLDL